MAKSTPGTSASKGGARTIPGIPRDRVRIDQRTGNPIYQPPMPDLPPGRFQAQVMPTPIDLRTGRPIEIPMFDGTGRIYEEKLPPPGTGTIPDFPQRKFPPFNRPQPRPPIRPQRPPFISRPKPIRPNPRPPTGSGASDFYRSPSYNYGVPTGLGALLSGQQSPFGRMVDPATGFPTRPAPRVPLPVMGGSERPSFRKIGRPLAQSKANALSGARTVRPEPEPEVTPPPAAPVFDDTAILERLSALEGRTPAPAFDPTTLQSRLTALEERRSTPAAPRFDDSALQQRLTALEARPTITPSRFDDSALRQRLTALEARPTMTASRFDDSALQQRLTALESRRIPTFDPSGLQQRLGALESRTSPTFDPSGLQNRLTALENRASPAAFDPTGLQSQITALQNRPTVSSFDPTSLQAQITALQNRPTVSAFDPSGLQRQIDALSSRSAPTAFDPSSLQSQISALNTRLDTAASSAGSKGSGMNVNPSMRAPSLGSVGTVVTPTGITNNRMATPRNLRRMGR
jgi:hypothetical protein